MSSKNDQLLTIKVMRLSRPVFHNSVSVSCDPWDLPGTKLVPVFEAESELNSETDAIMAGTTLILPQSFGTIYLGETFSCYLRVQNSSLQTVKDVRFEADLQTALQRVHLAHKSGKQQQPVSELHPQQSIDEVLNHEVTEIGTHILVCEVNYLSEAGEKQTSSRYYKFQVQKPLDVKTKFYNAESDDVFLEAQIQNITSGPLLLEKVILEPSALFTVSSLNSQPTDPGDSLSTPTTEPVQPGGVRQFLYCLKPREEARLNAAALRGASNIGKLDLVWRTGLGDRGRLQTSQLQRMAPAYGDIRLTVEQLDNPVELHKVFPLVCRISNTSERPVELSLIFESRTKRAAVLWAGLSNRPLGRIEANSSLVVTLNLVAVLPGLQTISGLRLVDLFLKRTYDYDDLAQVLVLPPTVLL